MRVFLKNHVFLVKLPSDETSNLSMIHKLIMGPKGVCLEKMNKQCIEYLHRI